MSNDREYRAKRKSPVTRSRRGFTLLELLLATTAAATIALALYGSFASAFRARKTMDTQLTLMRETAISLDLLEQDFQSLLRPNNILSGPFIGYAMGTTGAEADSVQFYAIDRDATTDEPMSEGIKQITLLLRSEGASTYLARQVTRNLLSTTTRTATEEILSRRVIAFSVRYYDGSSWYDEWDSTLHDNTLPLAVEINITVKMSDTTTAESYQMSRIVPLACGDNVNNLSSGGTQ
jgi:prepilin-type N-terminal cleavage/methylation domain-containing protein